MVPEMGAERSRFRQFRYSRVFYSVKAAFMSLLLFVAPVGAVENVERVVDLLERMAHANRQLDYQGIFTYEHAGTLRTVRVIHGVLEDGVYEKLLYLDGPKREIVRFGGDCNQRSLADKPAPVFSDVSPGADLQEFYDLHIRGDGRIADRAVRVVQVVPRDKFRYGHVFAIDRENGLLLQFLLIGDNRRVLERFQFVDIAPLSDAEKAALLPLDPSPTETCAEHGKTRADAATDWKLAWVPPGFEQQAFERFDDGLEALMYSDGLAVFTVFLDPGGGEKLPEMRAQRGATVAQIAKVTHQGQPYAISVVGEVPKETADRVASFVTFNIR